MYFRWGGAGFCPRYPPGCGGHPKKKCILGGWVAPDFVAPYLPQGEQGVARSGAEWHGDLLFPQGWGGSSKQIVFRGAPHFVTPIPPVGGFVRKNVFGGGVAPDFVAPYPQGGSSIKVYFEGWHRIFAPLPPPGSGGRLNKCIWGGEVRRFLSPPGGTGGGAEWRGVARSPVHFWSREARSGTEIWRGVARRPVHF